MKLRLAAALLIASLVPAFAQAPPAPYSSVFPPDSRTGQNSGGINGPAFDANTSSAGFGASSLSRIVGAGTTQATATDIITTVSIITACPAGAGVQLPNLERPSSVTILNRSGAACLVYASPNATVETALGVNSAVNGSASVANNTDTTFRLVSPTSWLQ